MQTLYFRGGSNTAHSKLGRLTAAACLHCTCYQGSRFVAAREKENVCSKRSGTVVGGGWGRAGGGRVRGVSIVNEFDDSSRSGGGGEDHS